MNSAKVNKNGKASRVEYQRKWAKANPEKVRSYKAKANTPARKRKRAEYAAQIPRRAPQGDAGRLRQAAREGQRPTEGPSKFTRGYDQLENDFDGPDYQAMAAHLTEASGIPWAADDAELWAKVFAALKPTSAELGEAEP